MLLAMVSEGTHQCPCCDYYTLRGRAGFEVCPVCYWEDDGQDLGELDVVSGPNHITPTPRAIGTERMSRVAGPGVSWPFFALANAQ